MRIMLVIEYEGTAYAGWQRQANALTVQQVLEEALERVLGQHTPLVGAGRTDAGVHAMDQHAHFDCETGIPPEKFSYVLNALLPVDIRVRKSCATALHARYDAKCKTYRYAVHNAAHPSAMLRNFTHHVRMPLNDAAMAKASCVLVGTHDFAAFRAAGSDMESSVRTIHALEVKRHGEDIYIDVTGNGFLYNMVRIIAGTLIDVGKGKKTPEDMPGILESRDRTRAGATAPAKGLTMLRLFYGESEKIPIICGKTLDTVDRNV